MMKLDRLKTVIDEELKDIQVTEELKNSLFKKLKQPRVIPFDPIRYLRPFTMVSSFVVVFGMLFYQQNDVPNPIVSETPEIKLQTLESPVENERMYQRMIERFSIQEEEHNKPLINDEEE